MKIKLVTVEEGIGAVGSRKMASFIRSINPDIQSYFIPLTSRLDISAALGIKKEEGNYLDSENIRKIAEALIGADIIGFSSYTVGANLIKRIIKQIRAMDPRVYIVWGGVHSIMDPEDAILHANAICTGEGEFAFKNFLIDFQNGGDFYKTKNFWFKKNEEIIRNSFLPLATNGEMDNFPFPEYAGQEMIFSKGKGFSPMNVKDYIGLSGLAYNTVWSIGCPYRCSFCGNTKFIENDKNYTKLRYPSVDYLIRQVKDAVSKHPHIGVVVFHDDSFMAIPKRVLSEFAARWKQDINLPFCALGVIPSFVREEKFNILVDAGMNRIRMGIQSGSDRILEFYERPNKPGLIESATSIIGKFKSKMIPPAYDIIVDNPVETKLDVQETLKLLYRIHRPFTLNVFSLRIIPNSRLAKQFAGLDHNPGDVALDFFAHQPTFANVMVHLLTFWKPPEKIFAIALKYCKPFKTKQPQFPFLLIVVRSLYLIARVYHHVRYKDFSLISGRASWFFWKWKRFKDGILGY